jgi:alpha-amylase
MIAFISCQSSIEKEIVSTRTSKEFVWQGANIYFLLTDRFQNADSSNDVQFNRKDDAAILRGFKGGDFKGVTQKIKEGYFTKLGINALWMTPVVEQIHAGTDEGTGKSYGYHGYWTKDWTAIDPNFGTKEDLKELVETAHKNGIRILLDAVINHTGPVTKEDPLWPKSWVRTTPQCTYSDYEHTITCTLVKNLPDIRTESNENVALPPQLVSKWKLEGRYAQEVKELDAFFTRTGHPRAPRFYIMKWLTDYITEYGIDGYRADTVKHTEEFVWQEFRVECDYAFEEFKKNNPEKVLDQNDFYLVGEVYNYGVSSGKAFDFGDKKVNYYDRAFNSLLNFELKWDTKNSDVATVFNKYDAILNSDLKGHGVLNYLSSHDDGQPFDAARKKPFKTAEMLLLTPGTSQVYYGDESARELMVEDATGDANLRSLMNWSKIKEDLKTKLILAHWQKIGQFRANHPAVGAGKQQVIPMESGFAFSRVRNEDKVIIGLELPKGKKVITVAPFFKNNETLRDAYTQQVLLVKDGEVTLISPSNIVLLEKVPTLK